MSRIPIEKVTSLQFRIKNLNYNKYFIDHSQVKGVLYLINVVTNIGEVPIDVIPAAQRISNEPQVGVSYQPIVSFINKGKRFPPTELPKSTEIANKEKTDLTDFIIHEEDYEPWNEYVIQGEPPRILKTKTILSKVLSIVGIYNNLGDPYILANHNTTYSVSVKSSAESGLS